MTLTLEEQTQYSVIFTYFLTSKVIHHKNGLDVSTDGSLGANGDPKVLLTNTHDNKTQFSLVDKEGKPMDIHNPKIKQGDGGWKDIWVRDEVYGEIDVDLQLPIGFLLADKADSGNYEIKDQYLSDELFNRF